MMTASLYNCGHCGRPQIVGSPCQDCEYHKNRAARWRAEAYKQGGHDVIELPWVGLTDEEINGMVEVTDLSGAYYYDDLHAVARATEAKLKEKNT